MIVEIIDLNGDEKDIQYRDMFIIKSLICSAFDNGARIIYRPNLEDMPKDNTERYLTYEQEYQFRHQELTERFPFLHGLGEIQLTLLPNGVYAPIYNSEIDEIIKHEGSRLVVVGGKYKKGCVAAEVINLSSRNPGIDVCIGDDISIENQHQPIEGYDSLLHKKLLHILNDAQTPST